MFSSFLSRSSGRLDSNASIESKANEPKLSKRNVLVTGAGGQTGAILVQKLFERAASSPDDFALIRCLVRSKESEAGLRSKLDAIEGLIKSSPALFEVVIGDISDPDTLDAPFKGIDCVVVCTSAIPEISKVSLACMMTMKLLTFSYSTMKPSFWFKEGQKPEEIDWLGQDNQFRAAEAAGVKHVVLVSSMCGTRPDHFLNTNMENIVLWKRKAEASLISIGLPYTIIHPSGLLPHGGGGKTPAPGGKRQLFVGVDDRLLDGSNLTVPREDVAQVCVACVCEPEVAAGRSFDLTGGPEGEGTPWGGSLQELLAPLEGKNCHYSEADSAFCTLQRNNGRGCYCY